MGWYFIRGDECGRRLEICETFYLQISWRDGSRRSPISTPDHWGQIDGCTAEPTPNRPPVDNICENKSFSGQVHQNYVSVKTYGARNKFRGYGAVFRVAT